MWCTDLCEGCFEELETAFTWDSKQPAHGTRNSLHMGLETAFTCDTLTDLSLSLSLSLWWRLCRVPRNSLHTNQFLETAFTTNKSVFFRYEGVFLWHKECIHVIQINSSKLPSPRTKKLETWAGCAQKVRTCRKSVFLSFLNWFELTPSKNKKGGGKIRWKYDFRLSLTPPPPFNSSFLICYYTYIHKYMHLSIKKTEGVGRMRWKYIFQFNRTGQPLSLFGYSL